MERRRASVSISLIALLALAACHVVPVTIPYVPPTPLPSSTWTPVPPTVTPDTEIATAQAADVFCEKVSDSNITQTIVIALLNGKSTKTVNDLIREGWFVSVHKPAPKKPSRTDEQRVFTDTAVRVFTGKSTTVNTVTDGTLVCTSQNELAASTASQTRTNK